MQPNITIQKTNDLILCKHIKTKLLIKLISSGTITMFKKTVFNRDKSLIKGLRATTFDVLNLRNISITRCLMCNVLVQFSGVT